MPNIRFDKLMDESFSSWNQRGQIREEWAKMVEGKSVNLRKVPIQIHESWLKARESAVDPFDPSLVLCDETEVIGLKKYQSIFENIMKVCKTNGYALQIFDKMGHCLDTPDEKWFQEIKQLPNTNITKLLDKIAGKELVHISISENKIGINAANQALQLNKPYILLAAQHYSYSLHTINCSAAPIHDINGDVLGVLNIITRDIGKTWDAFLLVNSLARMFDFFVVAAAEQERVGFDETELSNILTQMPQGIVYIDSRNIIKYYNERVIEIFGLNKIIGVEAELAKYLAQLNCHKNIEKQRNMLTVQGIPKAVIVSVKEVTDGKNEQKNRLIILEAEENKKCSVKSGNKQNLYTFDNIIGKNINLREVKTLAARIAGNDYPIMIIGESGTGKELFAQAIHSASMRRDKPFIAINCGAIPNELVESEMFGYEPGSFTGALPKGKRGQIEVASGGTLFLDEIESMPLNIQIKLLRTLSTQKIMKVGSTVEIPVDIRVISATKKDLLKEADNGKFREDLYYRISTFLISLPALRERIDDIPVLAKHYVDNCCQEMRIEEIKIQDEFLEALKYYYWRGNIREFKNVIERAMILMDNQKELTIEQLPNHIVKDYIYRSMEGKITSSQDFNKSEDGLLQIGENIIIDMVLQESVGNISKAANRLGVSKQTLYNKIKDNPSLHKFK